MASCGFRPRDNATLPAAEKRRETAGCAGWLLSRKYALVSGTIVWLVVSAVTGLIRMGKARGNAALDAVAKSRAQS